MRDPFGNGPIIRIKVWLLYRFDLHRSKKRQKLLYRGACDIIRWGRGVPPKDERQAAIIAYRGLYDYLHAAGSHDV